MKKEFKITEREAGLLERVAEATKMDNWFCIDEDLVAKDTEEPENTPEEVVCTLEDGLGYGLTEPQSGGLSEEEAKEVEAVFRRARYARCDWKKFGALVYVEGSANQLPTYLIEGIFEEGVFLNLEDAPNGIAMLRITHHSTNPHFPAAMTHDKYKGCINFFGTAMVIESRLPEEVLKAIKAGKCLMVSYDRDEGVDDGVGPGGHLFPVWNVA